MKYTDKELGLNKIDKSISMLWMVALLMVVSMGILIATYNLVTNDNKLLNTTNNKLDTIKNSVNETKFLIEDRLQDMDYKLINLETAIQREINQNNLSIENINKKLNSIENSQKMDK